MLSREEDDRDAKLGILREEGELLPLILRLAGSKEIEELRESRRDGRSGDGGTNIVFEELAVEYKSSGLWGRGSDISAGKSSGDSPIK